MLKKVLLIILVLISGIGIYLYKQAVLDPSSVGILSSTTNIVELVPQNYITYFFLKDEDPIYVWDNKIVEAYNKDCQQKWINCSIMPFQQLYSSFLWLSSIQYIGTVVDSNRAPYLYAMLQNLTNLSPYWSYPYIFWQLLIPLSPTQSSGIDQEIINDSHIKAIQLWHKWISYTCDPQKTESIYNLSQKEFYDEVNKGISQSPYLNPCLDWNISSYQWFNEFYYVANYPESSKFYKLASFNNDNPAVTASMVGIVIGKSGQHLKSMQLWFSNLVSLEQQLQKTQSDDEKAFLDEKRTESLQRIVFEYQLHTLSNITSKARENERPCFEDYTCITQRGFIKTAIVQDQTKCTQENLNNIDLSKTVIDEDSQDHYSTLISCLALGWGSQQFVTVEKDRANPIINLQSWEFEFYRTTEKDHFKFRWDPTLNDWTVSL